MINKNKNSKLLKLFIHKLYGALCSCVFLFASSVSGIVIYEPFFIFPPPDNPISRDTYRAVAMVCDADGLNTSGSAVYIKDKYLLTANSVADRSHVTFDGFTFYERDLEFQPKQIVADGQPVDLKVIKLLENPFGFEIPMQSMQVSDSNLAVAYEDAYIVGWGEGNDPNLLALPIFPRIWPWGGIDTIEKRWGDNGVERAEVYVGQGYQYDALVTVLRPDFTDSRESGITQFDLGGGIFSKIDDEWQLIGIATHMTQNSGENTSTFTFDPNPSEIEPNPLELEPVYPDLNYFVRISSYVDEIEAAMVEPLTFSVWAMTQGLVGADALNTADTDGDGIIQLLEYALGGNPNQSDVEIYPTSQLVQEGDKSYLEITLLRPQGLANTTYTPEVSLDLSNWAEPSAFDPAIPFMVADPVVVGEGIESVVYRVEVTQDERVFVRLRVSVAS